MIEAGQPMEVHGKNADVSASYEAGWMTSDTLEFPFEMLQDGAIVYRPTPAAGVNQLF